MTTLIEDLTPSDDSSLDTNDYNPTEDENQGVITKLTQGQAANTGVAQAEYMNPVTNQGPEPVKEEANDESMSGSNGVNDDLLAEEDVEAGDVEADNETDE